MVGSYDFSVSGRPEVILGTYRKMLSFVSSVVFTMKSLYALAFFESKETAAFFALVLEGLILDVFFDFIC